MSVFLKGLALGNYRGIGPVVQKMGPFKKFNLFIGANNVGKSAVLNFISKHLPLGGPKAGELSLVEAYRGGSAGPLIVAIAVPTKEFIETAVSHARDDVRRIVTPTINTFANAISENSNIWIKVNLRSQNESDFLDIEEPLNVKDYLPYGEWQNLWRAYTNFASGGDLNSWIGPALAGMKRQKIAVPNTRLIPAVRQIGPSSESFDDYSGRGLIDRLAAIQNPPFDKRQDREIFLRINRFLKSVTGDDTAEIEIPHDRAHVSVHMGGLVLPLEALGTGIHEVVMIAAFCTLSSLEIICIEEPEIHLHPLLQRKLIKYLDEETENQYFIATHSAAFIDTPGAAIFHVTRSSDQTIIDQSILRRERYDICVDLGHKASDLLQANSVIWVEGPSDRIYLKHWLSAAAPELIEGIHFSIMFYGGRLLSHLSADDEAVSDFIDLKALNQNMAIILDSDKDSEGDAINATKLRISEEIASGSGISWITMGREIENYVPAVALQQAVKAVYADVYAKPVKTGVYDHALYFKRIEPKKKRDGTPYKTLEERDVDKVAVAHEVCRSEPDFSVLDLGERIEALAEMIRAANF